jgi:hypothetical protein
MNPENADETHAERACLCVVTPCPCPCHDPSDASEAGSSRYLPDDSERTRILMDAVSDPPTEDEIASIGASRIADDVDKRFVDDLVNYPLKWEPE